MTLDLDSSLTDDPGFASAGGDVGSAAWIPSRPARGARMRLARELHDQAGWHIAALNYGLFAAERDPGNPEKLKEVRHRLEALSMALRELIEQTRVAPRQGSDLPKALAALCRGWTDLSGIVVDFDAAPLGTHPSAEIGRAIIAIAREALTNVAKHAPTARCVAVVLRAHGTRLRLEIADDGPGLDFDRLNDGRNGGRGLLGMRERVALLGGTLEIGCGRNGGVCVVAVMPRRILS